MIKHILPFLKLETWWGKCAYAWWDRMLGRICKRILKIGRSVHCLKYSLKFKGLTNYNKKNFIHKYKLYTPTVPQTTHSPVSYPFCIRALCTKERERLWCSSCYYSMLYCTPSYIQKAHRYFPPSVIFSTVSSNLTRKN